MAVAALAGFLPSGPGIPGMDWELGEKADPLAPAYPGIKPEWYFLWEYQLLKEFPPHLFGLEGPQVCLLLIALLFGIWAIIPWLDRRAYRDKPSPAFTDLGWAAILFLTFLTLAGWDIGARGAGSELAAMHNVSRVCAWWTLARAGGHCCSVLALRGSLVHPDWRSVVARGAVWPGWCSVSTRRSDLGRGGRCRDCNFIYSRCAG
jgi:quinol-cytochrome oxidoreductase complex cytochrome b subunit